MAPSKDKDPSKPKPNYPFFAGVDIAARTYTIPPATAMNCRLKPIRYLKLPKAMPTSKGF
jgi:hypothetical protein